MKGKALSFGPELDLLRAEVNLRMQESAYRVLWAFLRRRYPDVATAFQQYLNKRKAVN